VTSMRCHGRLLGSVIPRISGRGAMLFGVENHGSPRQIALHACKYLFLSRNQETELTDDVRGCHFTSSYTNSSKGQLAPPAAWRRNAPEHGQTWRPKCRPSVRAYDIVLSTGLVFIIVGPCWTRIRR